LKVFFYVGAPQRSRDDVVNVPLADKEGPRLFIFSVVGLESTAARASRRFDTIQLIAGELGAFAIAMVNL
jgi:hypothetical protein